MRILPVLSGTLLFVLLQMSSPEVIAHHSAHFSNTSSVDLLNETSKNSLQCDFSPFRERRSYSAEELGAGVNDDKLEVFRGSLSPITMVADTLRFCTELGNAELPASNQVYLGEGHPDASKCSLHIWTTHTVVDDCGGNVTYDVRLYPNNGPQFIQIVTPTTVPLDQNQEAELNLDTRSSSLPPDHQISLHGVPLTSGSCATGNHHRLLWTVVNACDEMTSYEYLIRVEDCERPIALCVELSSIVMPSSFSLTLWAKDIVYPIQDDCTRADDIALSFDRDEYVPSRTFSCGDFCDGPSFLLSVWAADEGIDLNCNGEIDWSERRKDSCLAWVIIDEGSGNPCDCDPAVGGRVRTPLGAGIIDVTVNLHSPLGGLLTSAITNQNGYYEFPFVIVNPLLHYTFEPVKEDNYKNGVSTLDLIQIQKHLLGITPFDSPFELIAADANNSESVSALDLVEIRKLILGVITEFDGPSWRFVPEDFQFVNPGNPWPFSESVMNAGMPIPNFIGVKVGDIHSANNLTTIEVRNAPEILLLFIEDRPVGFNQELEIPVYSDDVSNLLGLQLTMSTRGLEYLGVEPGLMNISEDCIANHHDAIALSWAGVSPISLDNKGALFTLRFQAQGGGRLKDMLQLNSSITKSEAYREGDVTAPGSENIEVLNVQLRVGPSNFKDQSNKYQLDQNTPNPFTDQTVIGFNLPSAMIARIGIFNVFGQEIYQLTGDFNEGYNTVTLNKDIFKGMGIYGYYLKTPDLALSKTLMLSD